jgi:hypothetical protein
MNNTIPKKLTVLAAGVALAVPLWAAGAASTNASPTRIERLDRIERLEKLQKLEQLEKAGKLDKAQEAKLNAMIAQIRSSSKKPGNIDVIAEAARFDVFLTANPQIAAELEKNPSMIDNKAFMANNPALTAWLKDHPNVAKELRANPHEFLKVAIDLHTLASSPAFKAMSAAGITMGELARYDLYLVSHPNIAKELKSDPSLISDPGFLTKNPELAAWLTAHPDIAKELQDNPQLFLKLSVDLYAQLSSVGLATLL